MSKFAIITDTHFGARSDSLVFHEHFAKFYKNQFFPTLDKLGITRVVHAGDLVDRRKYINFNILRLIKQDFIDPIVERGIEMDAIVGNHDATFKNTNEVNAIGQLFSDSKNIKIHTEAAEIYIDKTPILLLPWINVNNYDHTLVKIKKTKAKLAIGHLELAGFCMSKGIQNTEGMDKKIFRKFDQVFTGHYHHKSDDGKIFYLGPPYEMTFSDCNDPKGFHIYDTDTKELTFFENPHKMFYRIYYDDQGKSLEELFNGEDFAKFKGTYVKVIVSKKTNPFFFDKFLEHIYQVTPADISVVEDFDHNLDSEEVVDMAEDTLTILNKYVDGMDLDVDKNKIKDQIHEVYLEACNMENE